MYYALIILSVVMFGGSFALNEAYQKRRGSTLKISLWFSLIGSFSGTVVLFIANGFRFEFTPFTLLMAMIGSAIGFGFTFCGFRALGTINLSLYSLFSMLGGMLLPFLQGIIFYGEGITVAKIVCFVFIVVALLLTVEKGEKRSGAIYYIGIFMLNGLSGVFAKIFTSSELPKTSATGYSLLMASCTVVMSALILLMFFRKKDDSIPPETPAGVGICVTHGAINRIANLLLVIALAHVDASVQYPMVTGGVMIVSTLICFFGKNKPNKKEILSVILAFIGMLALFAIPI